MRIKGIILFVRELTQMSLAVRKPVFGVSDQALHKPGCATTQDGLRH